MRSLLIVKATAPVISLTSFSNSTEPSTKTCSHPQSCHQKAKEMFYYPYQIVLESKLISVRINEWRSSLSNHVNFKVYNNIYQFIRFCSKIFFFKNPFHMWETLEMRNNVVYCSTSGKAISKLWGHCQQPGKQSLQMKWKCFMKREFEYLLNILETNFTQVVDFTVL